MIPKTVRKRWRAARKLRKAKRQIERALWTSNRGYGMGKKFNTDDGVSDNVYNLASEIMGSLESAARVFEGTCD